tara:strand:+ start:5827 stop:6198 length:372 start_codon:yes stop_codon:yes gene_type:complete
MTLVDFYTHVLRALKVVPPNGTALGEDIQRVKDVYPVVHAYLLERKLIDFAAADAVPNKYVIPLTKVVAYQLTDDFSVPDMILAKLKSEGELDAKPIVSKGEIQLRKLMDQAYVPSDLQIEYF